MLNQMHAREQVTTAKGKLLEDDLLTFWNLKNWAEYDHPEPSFF